MSPPAGFVKPPPEGSDLLRGVHRFAHKAMSTIFEAFVGEGDAQYARQAAQAAFEEVDRLETDLSRFNPASDISHINQLAAGKAIRVGLDTFECLRVARRVWQDTGGAFDVTVGRLYDLWKPKDGKPASPTPEELAAARAATGMRHVHLDEKEHAVGVWVDGIRLDLGAIGKGYAVDRMAAVLAEWNLATWMVHGGESTVLAGGPPPGQPGWRISVGDPEAGGRPLRTVVLAGRALSGSSLAPAKPILDPRIGRPASANVAAWSLCAKATEADALSTAFLVLAADEVAEYCRKHTDAAGMVKTAGSGEDRLRAFGAW
jgi:thiamine biosynthesis lipoprotein